MAAADDAYLTVAEVAARLRVNEQTVRNWIDHVKLAAVRAGRHIRVTESALAEMTGQQKQGPAPLEVDREAIADALDQIAAGIRNLAKAVRQAT